MIRRLPGNSGCSGSIAGCARAVSNDDWWFSNCAERHACLGSPSTGEDVVVTRVSLDRTTAMGIGGCSRGGGSG